MAEQGPAGQTEEKERHEICNDHGSRDMWPRKNTGMPSEQHRDVLRKAKVHMELNLVRD